MVLNPFLCISIARDMVEGGRKMLGLGAQELIIILGIVVLIFGEKRLPELGSGVGKAIRNFKGGIKSIETEDPEKSGEEGKEEAKTPGPMKPS
jgi:sec-independent protein translocase protein TatA